MQESPPFYATGIAPIYNVYGIMKIPRSNQQRGNVYDGKRTYQVCTLWNKKFEIKTLLCRGSFCLHFHCAMWKLRTPYVHRAHMERWKGYAQGSSIVQMLSLQWISVSNNAPGIPSVNSFAEHTFECIPGSVKINRYWRKESQMFQVLKEERRYCSKYGI